jgi:hypothetical protein
MPRIEVHQKTITRVSHPSNSNIDDHIASVRSNFICIFESSSVPNKGEIIYLQEEERKYIVTDVVRVLSSETEEKIILEVAPHSTERLHKHGSNAWMENVPLVVELDTYKDTLSPFDK